MPRAFSLAAPLSCPNRTWFVPNEEMGSTSRQDGIVNLVAVSWEEGKGWDDLDFGCYFWRLFVSLLTFIGISSVGLII